MPWVRYILGFLCLFSAVAFPASYTCWRVLKDAGMADLVVLAQADRIAMDLELKAAARELQSGNIGEARRKELHNFIAGKMFPLMLRTALRRHPQAAQLEYEDLFDVTQDAITKLLRTVDDGRYDPERENRFFTYAYAFMKNEVSRKAEKVSVRERHDPIDPKYLEREIEEAAELEGDLFAIGARAREVWNQLSWRHREVLYEFANGLNGDEVGTKLGVGGGANANRIKLQALQRLVTLIALDEHLPETVRQKIQTVEPSTLLHLVDVYVDSVSSSYTLNLAAAGEFPAVAPRERREEPLRASLRTVWDDLSFHERKKLYEAAQLYAGDELSSQEKSRLGNAVVMLKDRLRRLPDTSEDQQTDIRKMLPEEILMLVRMSVHQVDDKFQLDGL